MSQFTADQNKLASGRYFTAVMFSIGAVIINVLCLVGIGMVIIGVVDGKVSDPMPVIQALLAVVVLFMNLVAQVVAFYFGTKVGEAYAKNRG